MQYKGTVNNRKWQDHHSHVLALCYILVGNETVIYYCANFLLLRRPPLKTTLLVKMGPCINTLGLNGNLCCNQNKLKYMFVKDACETK